MNPIKFLCTICFLLLVLRAFSVYSQETDEYKVEFSVYDLYSRQEILSNFAKISASSKETESQLDFSFQNKNASEFNISFFLSEGRWDFKIEIDDFQTPALDYYIIHSLNLEDDIAQNIYLLRVGNIKGIVKDNSDKLVSNAKIKFECERDDFIGILESDLFGTFSTKIAPEGNCKVYATYGDSVGITEVIVEKGKVSDVTVVLDQKVVFFDINNIITIVLLSVIGVISLFIIVKYLKSKTKEKQKEATDLNKTTQNENNDDIRKAEVEISSYEPEHKEQSKKSSEEQKGDDIVEIDYSFSGEKHHISKRSIDILNSLSNGQKKVVEFLLEEGNHSSQARISRVGKIPKSTLHRYLSELEEKNIIQKKEDFGQNRVFLTDYFLSEK